MNPARFRRTLVVAMFWSGYVVVLVYIWGGLNIRAAIGGVFLMAYAAYTRDTRVTVSKRDE